MRDDLSTGAGRCASRLTARWSMNTSTFAAPPTSSRGSIVTSRSVRERGGLSTAADRWCYRGGGATA